MEPVPNSSTETETHNREKGSLWNLLKLRISLPIKYYPQYQQAHKMGCVVSRRRHQQVCKELEKLRERQTLQEKGYNRARSQAIRDRNRLQNVEKDVNILRAQLFDTSEDLMTLAKRSSSPVAFSCVPLNTAVVFKATLL